ncbi:Kynurenine formamidase [Actinopolyspora lacussalsi subsp. righensis]|uniref:Kynurenine formamidase n=1 Tax=Actinopolyspora righensis TaxID=995060 RepID=A0A1I7C2Z7_9ACTN|nr:cyclase family protein [Actinopolyspora righensis]SFT93817.1 Kynurenine formamidase [Actinopolyspora righensis]
MSEILGERDSEISRSTRNVEVVDLSLQLSENLPCDWSLHQPFQHKVWNWFATRDEQVGPIYNRSGVPYATSWMAIDEHTGTHFDAPSHFVPPPGSGVPGSAPAGEISAEKVEISQLMGSASVLDLSFLTDQDGEAGVSPFIRPEHITAWEDSHGTLNPESVVLFRTGWDRFFQPKPQGSAYLYDVIVTGKSPGWPAPDVPTMELLIERGVRCVGTDAPSMGAAHDGVPVHVRGLSEGMLYVECLTGLEKLSPKGDWFCFLPLKVEGGTGAPGRAVALRQLDR